MASTEPRRLRSKNLTTLELPLDVIFSNILPRLPARSVMKFWSVSKQWYSFLKSLNFVNMHLNYVINDDHHNHRKLLVLYKYGIYSFVNRDCETHKPGMSRRRPLPFEVNSRDVKMKSSCNGLVLIALEEKNSGNNRDLILWNPLTGDYKTLSKIKCHNAKFELYYNSSKKDYRILLLSLNKDVYIYSLKSDSWRRINSEDAFQCFPNTLPHLWSPSACWFKNLYFKDYENNLIRFDTKTEKFTMIATPFQKYRLCSKLTVQRDCIHMCAQKDDNTHIELWKMNKIGDWEQVSTYAPVRDSEPFLDPLHLMRDGYWIMRSQSNCYWRTIYTVDLEKKHSKDSPLPYNLKGFVEGVYIETLVSLNQYFDIRT